MRKRCFNVSHSDGSVSADGLGSSVYSVAYLFAISPRGAALQGCCPGLAAGGLRSPPELLEVKRARHELDGAREVRRSRNEFLDRPATHAAPPDFQRRSGELLTRLHRSEAVE